GAARHGGRAADGAAMRVTAAREIAQSIRSLVRAPGFTLVAVLTLALGIAGNAVVFSLMDAVVLRPLPYPDPDRLVRLFETNLDHGWDQFSISAPDYHDWRDQSTAFDSLAAWRSRNVTVTGRGEAERVGACASSAALLPLLGANPAIGRLFGAD